MNRHLLPPPPPPPAVPAPMPPPPPPPSHNAGAGGSLKRKNETNDDDDDFDVDTFLRVEATSYNQDLEVDRILALAAKAANPIEILDLPGKIWTEGVFEPRDIKMSYRKKSLLLHPDKCRHVRATDVFEMLKKAESELMEEGKRAWLMSVVAEARAMVLKKRGLMNKQAGGSSLPQIPSFEKDPAAAAELAVAIKIQTRLLLADQSGRDSLRLKNEVERKAQEQTQMAEEKKKKQEYDKAWEACRCKAACG